MSDQATITRRNTVLGATTLAAVSALGSGASNVVASSPARAQSATKSLDTRIGRLQFTHEFPGGYPTEETVDKLYDERDFQRAVQVYLWALPMVGFGGLKRVLMQPQGAGLGVIYAAKTFSILSHFLTPNVTTPYIFTWLNLAETGLYVIEIPPGPIAGFVTTSVI